MFNRVRLLDEQRDLLLALVEASRRQPKKDRRPFLLLQTMGGDQIIHPSLPGGSIDSVEEDLDILGRHGLVSLKRAAEYTISFYVTPEGFDYHDQLKTEGRGPVEQVEADLRQLMDSEGFQNRYPEAHKKWIAAEALLWKNSEQDLSTIGHLCREAMQEFATALVERFKPEDASPNKSNDVNRIKAAIVKNEERLGAKRNAFMNALIDYWGTLTDMIQRQEHAGAKEGEPITWADARSVVFHTLVVFSEFDRSLS